MSSVSGNLKANKLTLQGHGVLAHNDVVMQVDSDTFTLGMGSNVLFTVAPEGVTELDGVSTSTPAP